MPLPQRFLSLAFLSSIPFLLVQAADTANPGFFSISTTSPRNHDALHIASISKTRLPSGNFLENSRTDEHGQFSYSSVAIGTTTNPQNMSLLLDTGSSDMWIYTTAADPSNILGGGHLFNPADSSTFKPAIGNFSIEYQNLDSYSGGLGTDIVQIGQSRVNQTFGEVPYTRSSIAGNDLAGIIGLARGTGSAMPQQTKWFDNVKSQIKSPLFTYSADWKTGGGTWDFGVIDQTRYTGNITYLPLSSGGICPRGYWGIDGVGVVINGKSYQHSDCISIDSGSPYNALDPEIVKAYYDQVPGATLQQKVWVFSCKVPLPDLRLDLAGKGSAVIPGHLMNFGFYDRAANLCAGSLFNSTGYAALGQIFMQAQFVVFDDGNARLGFASLPS